jgi:hypothetical protein
MSDTVRLKINVTERAAGCSEALSVLDFIPREALLLEDKASGITIPAFAEQILAADKRDVLMIRDASVALRAGGALTVNATYYLGNASVNVMVKHDDKHILSVGSLCSTDERAQRNNPYFAVLLGTGEFLEFWVDRE